MASSTSYHPRRPSQLPRDTPPSPAHSLVPSSCFACAPLSMSISMSPSPISTTIPFEPRSSQSALPTPPSLTPSTPSLSHSPRRTSTLLPRGSTSLRHRISIRPTVAPARTGKNTPPPVSITLAVAPSLIPPHNLPLDPSLPIIPASQPPTAFRSRFRVSRRSTAPPTNVHDENNKSNTFSISPRKGSVHKAAAERILQGHRKPPHPPTSPPLPLIATLMATVPDAPYGNGIAPLARLPSIPSLPRSAKVPPAGQGPEHPSTSAGTLEPIDVRDTLSKCDDPSMSWSLQFWVTIADPLVGTEPNLLNCLVLTASPDPRRLLRLSCLRYAVALDLGHTFR